EEDLLNYFLAGGDSGVTPPLPSFTPDGQQILPGSTGSAGTGSAGNPSNPNLSNPSLSNPNLRRQSSALSQSAALRPQKQQSFNAAVESASRREETRRSSTRRSSARSNLGQSGGGFPDAPSAPSPNPLGRGSSVLDRFDDYDPGDDDAAPTPLTQSFHYASKPQAVAAANPNPPPFPAGAPRDRLDSGNSTSSNPQHLRWLSSLNESLGAPVPSPSSSLHYAGPAAFSPSLDLDPSAVPPLHSMPPLDADGMPVLLPPQQMDRYAAYAPS
ncbi:hypothetical protein TeGR_g12383, partial [Tetraparma gracilis]